MSNLIQTWKRNRANRTKEDQLIKWLHKCTLDEYVKAGAKRPSIQLIRSETGTGGLDFTIDKHGNALRVYLNKDTPVYGFADITNKIAAASYWMQHTDSQVKSITLFGDDGQGPSTADYSYSSCSSSVSMLPDPHFFRSHGYKATNYFASTKALKWDDRSDKIVWRGRVNNSGLFSLDPALQDNPGVMQRLRMAQKCQALGIDFRFVDDVNAMVHGPLAAVGLIGEFIPTHDWGGMKYAIDIDGFTNAWCNFMERLKLGCCVLKVESQFGFRQWYYHKLTAWEHYVPISADMSDLAANVDWVKSNPDKARAIAAAGQELARAMTFETETRVAADIINTTEGAI